MKSRIGVIAVVGVAFLLFGTGALADEITGTQPVRAKNTRTNTVQLGELTYRLNSDSVIRDGGGNLISLAELEVPDLGRGESDGMLAAFLGEYVATRNGRNFVLVSLNILSLSE